MEEVVKKYLCNFCNNKRNNCMCLIGNSKKYKCLNYLYNGKATGYVKPEFSLRKKKKRGFEA